MKVICTFFLIRNDQLGGKGNEDILGTGPVARLEITSIATGRMRQVTVCKLLNLQFNLGDKIRCISGRTLVLINPNSPAGFKYLAEKPEILSSKKWQNELTLNKTATKARHRGKASFFEGIGNDVGLTGTSTR